MAAARSSLVRPERSFSDSADICATASLSASDAIAPPPHAGARREDETSARGPTPRVRVTRG
eukprot:4191319-Prymnesium_polylepis.1